jgi:hypothetical protein
MAGYSGTPLPRKLGIKPAHAVAILRPPDGFHNYPGELPDGVSVRDRARGSLGVDADITEDVVREVALPRGLVDNKVCAIDETWSGLRLVIRVENRPAR